MAIFRRNKLIIKYISMLLALFYTSISCKSEPFEHSIAARQKYQMMEGKVAKYLSDNVSIVGFGGDSYCASEWLGGDENYWYLFTHCQEYYLEQKLQKQGTGTMSYLRLKIVDDKIVAHDAPRDGAANAADILTLFPNDIVEIIQDEQSMRLLRTKLLEKINEQVKKQ